MMFARGKHFDFQRSTTINTSDSAPMYKMLVDSEWSSWKAGLGIFLLFLFAASPWRKSRHYKHLPMVNGKQWFEVSDTRSKAEFFMSARDLLYKGRAVSVPHQRKY